MDGTVIRNTDSVTLLCNLNHANKQVMDVINTKEKRGIITWIEADYERISLINGLEVSKISEGFTNKVKIIDGLKELVIKLHEEGWIVALVTAGPKQVAEIIAKQYNFDYCYGSIYEIINGKFTDRIISHMGDKGKVKCLIDLCNIYNSTPEKCVAVGDSSSDIEIFKQVGVSIAINYSNAVEKNQPMLFIVKIF